MPHSLMHVPHGVLAYVLYLLAVTCILFAGSGLPFLWSRERDERETRVDIVTISVKIAIFDVAPNFFGTTDLHKNLNTY